MGCAMGAVLQFSWKIRPKSLPETNIASEDRPSPKRICHLPTIDFQWRAVNFREGIYLGRFVVFIGFRTTYLSTSYN